MAEQIVARRGDLVVERDPLRPSGRLLRQGEMDASYVDLADRSHLEFDYLRWMRMVLRIAHARRVLHIGGGGCALPAALAAEDPGGRQEVCEVNAQVLALARGHLGLRRAPGLRVRLVEGRTFLAGQGDRNWDAIVIDAFVGATVPRQLITVEAVAEVARIAPLGLVNVVDHRSANDVRAVAAALATAYPQVWALGGRVGNTVVVGSVERLALDRIAARAAADPSPARLTSPAALARLAAGTLPLRDEELRSSRSATTTPGDQGHEPVSATRQIGLQDRVETDLRHPTTFSSSTSTASAP
ncbi:MAG: spermidine synthase [Solirubrobacteraceae bacterium]